MKRVRLTLSVVTTAASSSLDDDHHLTLKLNKTDTVEYYAFRMERVRECGEGDIDADRLLASAWVYER